MTALAIVVMILEAYVAFFIWVTFSSKRNAMRWRAEEAESERDFYKRLWKEEGAERSAENKAHREAVRRSENLVRLYDSLHKKHELMLSEYCTFRQEVAQEEKTAWQDLAAILKGMQGSKRETAKRT